MNAFELVPGKVFAAALHLDARGEYARGGGVVDTVEVAVDPGWVSGKSMDSMSSPAGLRELASHLNELADRREAGR